MNAIKKILKIKNLQQKVLTDTYTSKQTVSKLILRQRKFNTDVVSHFEHILKVPAEYFVDTDGFCKILTDEEVYELENFLLRPSNTPYTPNNYSHPSLSERHYALTYGIKQLQRKIRSDILDVEKPIHFLEEALTEQENSLSLYQAILHSHSKHSLSPDEWHSLSKALHLLDVLDNQHTLENDSLSNELYNVFIKHRKAQELQRQKDINDYIELFGELPNDTFNKEDNF